MDNTILSGIISASIGLLGLIIGYFYREYQIRVKNLIHIYNIDSYMVKYDDSVDIDKNLLENCRKSELLDDLKKTEKYRNVYDNWDVADDLKQFWIDIKSDIDTILNIKKDKEFLTLLSKLFNNKYFEKYIKRFILKNKVDDLKTKLFEKKISISEVDDDGDVYIGFPEQNISFNTTKHPAAKAKYKLFLNNIASLDKDNILETFRRFVVFMDSEYQIGISSIDSLIKIKNDQSRWAFYVQIANISSSPFLMELEPKLKIRYKRNDYIIDLYTTIIKQNPKTGEDYIDDTSKPLLIKHNEVKELVVITKEREKDIEFGKTIREIFESKKGTYRIEWDVIKPGLFKNQKLRSLKKSFINETYFT